MTDESIEGLGQVVFMDKECKEGRVQLESVKINNKWRPALKTSQPDEDSAEIQAKPYSAPFVRL